MRFGQSQLQALSWFPKWVSPKNDTQHGIANNFYLYTCTWFNKTNLVLKNHHVQTQAPLGYQALPEPLDAALAFAAIQPPLFDSPRSTAIVKSTSAPTLRPLGRTGLEAQFFFFRSKIPRVLDQKFSWKNTEVRLISKARCVFFEMTISGLEPTESFSHVCWLPDLNKKSKQMFGAARL